MSLVAMNLGERPRSNCPSSPARLRVLGGCVETFGGYAEASGECADSESGEHAETRVASHREKAPLLCLLDEPLVSHREKTPLVSRRVGHRGESEST